jgi:hypothetical protein
MQARIYRLLQRVALLGIATHGASIQNRSYSYSRVQTANSPEFLLSGVRKMSSEGLQRVKCGPSDADNHPKYQFSA